MCLCVKNGVREREWKSSTAMNERMTKRMSKKMVGVGSGWCDGGGEETQPERVRA